MYMDYSKNNLRDCLNKYNNIFNKEILDYLNSLLELEISIVKNSINNNDRELLNELDLFRRIGIYNICNMASNVFDAGMFDKILYEYQDGISYKINTNINGNNEVAEKVATKSTDI